MGLILSKINLKDLKKNLRDIPAILDTYKDEWKGYGDWLGTGNIAQGKMRPFKEARALCAKT